MKPWSVLLVLLLPISLAWSDDTTPEQEAYFKDHPNTYHRIYNEELSLGAGAYRLGIPGLNGVGVKPVLGFDAFISPFNNPADRESPRWSVGGELSIYDFTNEVKVRRTDATFRAGYWFFNRSLGILARVGFTDTSAEGYESGDTALHFGAEARYRIPLGERVDLILNAGWTRYGSATMEHDTGISKTNDPFSNFACSVATFGLSNGCGDQIQTLTVPATNTADVGISLAYFF